ncbi:MAG: DUF2147 domain-containing protein [Bacteroidota bacterium]
MKNIFSILVCLFLSTQVYAQTGADEILGTWTTPDKSQILEFIHEGDAYVAVVRQAAQPEAVGKKPIWGLEFQGKGSYQNGKIYVQKRDMTAKCSAKLLSDQELRLTIKVGAMSKKVKWTRVDFAKAGK